MVTNSGLLCLIGWILIALDILLAFTNFRLFECIASFTTMDYHLLIVGYR